MGKERGKMIDVRCANPNCGQEIARYFKIPGSGNLLKMYIDEIRKDSAGIFSDHKALKEASLNDHEFRCPGCETRIGILSRIHGRLAMDIARGKLHPKRV